MIKITQLSKKYKVKRIEEKDIIDVYNIMIGNPYYFECCPPSPSIDTVKEDMLALPPNKDYKDKYYIGFYDDNKLIGIMDLIENYPSNNIAFIGLFMLDIKYQNRKIGSNIINDLTNYLIDNNYKEIRLGYVTKNKIAKSFWTYNGFKETGDISKQELYDVIVMNKKINI